VSNLSNSVDESLLNYISGTDQKLKLCLSVDQFETERLSSLLISRKSVAIWLNMSNVYKLWLIMYSH